MESSAAPAAGWFPDPGDPSAERWWSGAAWTEHTRQPLGAEVPAAFAPHLATLVEERPEPQPEAEPFVFSMTPSAAEPTVEPVVAPVAPVATAEPVAPAEPVAMAEPVAPAEPVVPATPEAAPAADPQPSMPALTVPWLTPDPEPMPAVQPAATSPQEPAGFAMPSDDLKVRSFAYADEVAPAQPTAPEPAPASEAPVPPAPVYADPAPAMPEFTAPSPSPTLGAPTDAPAAGYAYPSTPAAPTLPVEEIAAAGFVLPAAPVAALTAEALQTRPGKHADAAPEPPKPAAPALPAVRPVGFTSSADPDVASRYRSVIHSDSQEEIQAQAMAASAPAPVSMLTSSALAGGQPMATVSPYAIAPDTNKAADLAFRTGLGASIGVVVSFVIRVIGLADLAGGVLSLGAWVSGVVALVAGIVGLVLARRRGVGFGKALAGLLLGIFVAVVVPVASVLLVILLLGSLGFF